MNEKLKIALVTSGLDFGGSTTFLLYLGDGLRSLGIPSQVFSFMSDNPIKTEFAEAGIPVHVTDEKKSIFEDRLTALYQKIAEFEPNVVIASLGAEAFEMLRYVPPGVIRIGVIHDPINQTALPVYGKNLDGIVLVNPSPSWAETSRRLAPHLPRQFIAHGIPLPELGLGRTPNPEKPLRLTYFGRLTEVKGTRVFPEIIKQLRQRDVPFRWVIYGSGPDEDKMRELLASDTQSGDVVISPPVPRHELYRKIQHHDVFILASEIEGGPLTLLEAMSLGLVPVCNDAPCLTQEVVNPENGFIIPRAPAKYAEMISILHQDRPRLERMSAAARGTITKHYSTTAMAERYLAFIKSFAPAVFRIFWPTKIAPRPILGLNLAARIGQGTGLARQARRIVKRLRG